VDPTSVQAVVLAAGSSLRMGRDKLVTPFAGVPLARRVLLALAELQPLVVATPAVAEAVGDLPSVRLLVTRPTAGPAMTLALANGAVPAGVPIAVIACDLPFLDAALVRAFLARVPADADLAFPVVGGTPGHPVVWSAKARRRIAGLRDEDTPSRLRRDPALRVVPLEDADDGYVVDVDTPQAWAAAELRAATS
jgi:molybdenum cofactor cytidylyltransferase